jgi:hypothetical protein
MHFKKQYLSYSQTLSYNYNTLQDSSKMQLVPTTLHNAFLKSGGLEQESL